MARNTKRHEEISLRAWLALSKNPAIKKEGVDFPALSCAWC